MDAQTALRNRVWRSLPPVAISLTALYMLFTISHSLLLPADVAAIMIPLAGATSVALLAIALLVSRNAIPERFANALAFLVMLFLSINSAAHVFMTRDIAQTTNVMLVILGAGFFVLNRNWFTLTVTVAILSWALAVMGLQAQPQFTHFAFALLSATVASVVFRFIHVRDLVDNHRLRMESETQRQTMEELATRDPLTGLANRRKFQEVLEMAVANTKRSGHSLGVLYIDLDEFKTLNDTHGHEFGDEVLRAAGRLLQQMTRETDLVCRLGGDEFAVLVTGLKEKQALEFTLNKIRRRFDETEDVMGIPTQIKLSIGAAALPDDTEDLDELRRLADLRMYANKESMKQEIRKLLPDDVAARQASSSG